MIAFLRGPVIKSAAGHIIIDVNGVGYKVNVPVSVIEMLPEDGSPVSLHVQTQVREDDISLYGFSDDTDQRVFELLLTVTGVGPKAGLAFLSSMTAQQIAQAIGAGDVRAITRVPGVGPKTAQRMVLELKEKMAMFGFTAILPNGAPSAKAVANRDEKADLLDDVSSALMNLGYNKSDATRAADAALLEKCPDASTPLPKFADLLRAALNRLTRA